MEIGVVVPNGIVGSPEGVLSYERIRGFARAVEDHGLDSVWIYDHLLFHFPEQAPAGVLEGWTVLSGLAEATQRVKLGTFVLCTSFRNPAMLAKMAVTLDEMSNHRLILGLGAGWHKPEYTMFGYPFDHLVDRFEEALKIIVPLVRDGSVDFQGTYSSAVACELLPAPRRNIPVMIGASKPRMMSLTAHYADSWNASGLGRAASLAPHRASLDAAMAAADRDPSTLDVTAGISVAFPELGPVPVGATAPAKFLSGSVPEVAAGLREFADAGVRHVMAWLYPLSTESIASFAEAARLARAT